MGEKVNLWKGHLTAFSYIDRTTPEYLEMKETFSAISPGIFFQFDVIMALGYDLGYMTALMFDDFIKAGEMPGDTYFHIPAATWFNKFTLTNFTGASGYVQISDIGNPVDKPESFRNFQAEAGEWVGIGTWVESVGFDFTSDIIWRDGTTTAPDLDVRPPYSYWSCHSKESGYDSTGKTIEIHTPDGSDIDDIDIDYRCDGVIDCHNLSDEDGSCSTNYTILFICYGVVTGILIFLTCFLIVLVIVFGYCVKRVRMRAASPFFLLVVCFSCIVGFISTFAWYGKAHPVACGFQPWLLGLSLVSMISALCAKSFRIWRIFRIPMSQVLISNLELCVLWLILLIPALIILILWTIISTPTAEMREIDGDDHYVCSTGGFTGAPGGIIFFFILVGYEAVVLLFGLFLSFVTRNVPSMFNESRLLAICIFHITFLAVVAIPVVIVLMELSLFAAWIIRTTAVLYVFSSTLVLQFGPIMYGIVITDRCKNVKYRNTNGNKMSSNFSKTSGESLLSSDSPSPIGSFDSSASFA